jgi:hypothetical protein
MEWQLRDWRGRYANGCFNDRACFSMRSGFRPSSETALATRFGGDSATVAGTAVKV